MVFLMFIDSVINNEWRVSMARETPQEKAARLLSNPRESLISICDKSGLEYWEVSYIKRKLKRAGVVMPNLRAKKGDIGSLVKAANRGAK